MSRIKRKLWATRRRKIGALTAVLALVLAGAALAYVLTYTGVNGTITQTVPANVGNSGDQQASAAVTLSGSVNVALGSPDTSGSETTAECQASFAPGCKYTVPVTATNDTPNLVAETITGVTSVVTVDSTHAGAGCLASWFTFTSPTGLSSFALSSGTSTPQTAGNGSLDFTDSSANQQACAGATVTVTMTGSTTP